MNILCIDDDAEYLLGLKLELKKSYHIYTALTLAEGFEILKSECCIDVILLDIGLPDSSGMEGLTKIKADYPSVDVVMVTAVRDPKFVVHAVRAGSSDYIVKPYAMDELVAILEKLQTIRTMRNRHDALVADLNPMDTKARLLGSSSIFRELLSQAARLKGHNANVLILGESGTGKELLARYIHGIEGNPSRRPFIAVNCAAIPEGLIESELFGHEKGSFTGAFERKIGKFELANGGDIFLDEISTLKHDMQAKILRVLQEKEIVRVGGNSTIHTDFRVIAASNMDLAQMVENNQFRMDLYHRIRVVQLVVPPLRERKEDIPTLIAYFLERYGKSGISKKITSNALTKLQNYSWPGNIRELENVIHSLSILTPGDVIEEKHLPSWALNGIGNGVKSNGVPAMSEITTSTTFKDYVNRAERSYIEHILTLCKGDKTKAASQMNIGRTTLYAKLKELGLETELKTN
ncbi:MAG: sigma-54-dependent Fis family transcriptional regulator [Deltaproteobacteria bacterium]|nr:sigma-54-dependent Fis family transcriptional regulator [Deltaproteobacteria bacterium]